MYRFFALIFWGSLVFSPALQASVGINLNGDIAPSTGVDPRIAEFRLWTERMAV